MEQFIFTVNKIADELLEDFMYDSKTLFLHGGCYIFAKMIKNYYPECDIYINNDYTHCAIKYQDNLYDARGLIDSNNFKKASKEDIIFMEENFTSKYNINNLITYINYKVKKKSQNN